MGQSSIWKKSTIKCLDPSFISFIQRGKYIYFFRCGNYDPNEDKQLLSDNDDQSPEPADTQLEGGKDDYYDEEAEEDEGYDEEQEEEKEDYDEEDEEPEEKEESEEKEVSDDEEDKEDEASDEAIEVKGDKESDEDEEEEDVEQGKEEEDDGESDDEEEDDEEEEDKKLDVTIAPGS